MNFVCALPIHLHRFFTLALLLILLLLLLSAIDSAEGGTTLPPYLQRLPTRQEPKNERKKAAMHAANVVADISKSKRLCCIVFPLERKKGIGNVSHFVRNRKGIDGSV